MALTEAQLNTLYTEITTDPTGIGLSTPFSAGNYPRVAQIMNQVRATITVEKLYVSPRDLIATIVPGEYIALTQAQRDYIALIPALGTVDIRTGSSLRNALNAVFASGSATRAAYTALASRNGSRTEVLFGVDQMVSNDDVRLAAEMNA